MDNKEMKIYQIKDLENCNYGFMDYNFAKSHNFSLDDYEKVYHTMTSMDLNEIFETFNIDRPKDFKGHSLSVSDIVELDGIKYYCNSFNWEVI